MDKVARAVSIHARQLRRAKPPARKAGAAHLLRFNPRPPIKTGETVVHDVDGRVTIVSIHARQLRRAKLAGAGRPRTAITFQSTPAN